MDSKFRSAPFVMLAILCLLSFSNGQTSSRTLTVNDWSGSWDFTGFGIGTSSGNYYHLLSSADANQCAVIKEDASNNVVFAKLYLDNQCAGLTLDITESLVYFLNNEASYLGLYAVDPSNGTITNFFQYATMNISGGVSTFVGDQLPGSIAVGGNVRNSAGESCGGIIAGSSNQLLCSATEEYLGTYVNGLAS